VNGTTPAPENLPKWEGGPLVDSQRAALPQPVAAEEVTPARTATMSPARTATMSPAGTLDERADRSDASIRAAWALEFLARGTALRVAQQAELYAAIDAHCASPDTVWRSGEEGVLARVALALVLRPDFDERAFDAWIARHQDAYRELRSSSSLNTALLADVANRRRVLTELCVLLASEDASDAAIRARDLVLRQTG